MPKSVSEVADLLGVCPETYIKAMDAGQVPGVRVGSRIVITDEMVARLDRGEWRPEPTYILVRPFEQDERRGR